MGAQPDTSAAPPARRTKSRLVSQQQGAHARAVTQSNEGDTRFVDFGSSFQLIETTTYINDGVGNRSEAMFSTLR